MIKDTNVFRTFQLTVSLTEDAPEINGYDGNLDVVTFRPATLEIMWISNNGKPWEVTKILAKRWTGRETYVKTIQSFRLDSLPWVREIVNETRPNAD